MFQGNQLNHDFVTEAALRCEILGDVVELSAERINQFYAEQKDEQKTEGETPNGERPRTTENTAA